MSSARDSFAARLQAPYAGRVEKGSKGSVGYTVTAFDELPFAEAGYHKVFAEGNKFWRHSAVADADVWRRGSDRAGPVHVVLDESSESSLRRQWSASLDNLFEDFFGALNLPVKLRSGEEILNLPAWQNIAFRVRSRPDTG